MNTHRHAVVALVGAILATSAYAAGHSSGSLTPIRNTTTRAGYTIDTVGDTLGQASPQNTRLIDQGIDTIFEKVELTTAKAKDLEKPEAPAGEATPAESPPPP